MDREAFEQLLSAWLDEPDNAVARAELDEATAGDAELARLRIQYEALQRLLLAEPAALRSVAWEKLAARLKTQVGRAAAGGDEADRLDELLLALPGVERRVDWSALRRRIGEAIEQGRKNRDARRGRVWRLAAAVGTFAAAAALALFMLRSPGGPPFSTSAPPAGPSAARGVARIEILVADGVAGIPAAAGVARVTVLEDPRGPAPAPLPGADAPDESPPEIFFMVEPARVALAPVSVANVR